MKYLSAIIFFVTVFASSAHAQSQSYEIWVTQFEQEAIANGISPETARTVMDHATLDDRVIELDQKQPEHTVTFDSYVQRVLNRKRIERGRNLMAKHAVLLEQISKRYNVQPEVIVALWGVETDYGQNTGGFEIIDALTTLAFEGRRSDFFRSQLMDALRIIDKDHISPDAMSGSWAGAMGQCQFMPSTYLRYAVDYNNDGKRDIWESEADIFASIANYIAAEGWNGDQTWGREVETQYVIPPASVGLDHKHSLAEWTSMGVTDINGNPLPNRQLQASLVQPDGPDGRSFLVYDSFWALMRWNRSTYFATSVGLLSDQIKNSR